MSLCLSVAKAQTTSGGRLVVETLFPDGGTATLRAAFPDPGYGCSRRYALIATTTIPGTGTSPSLRVEMWSSRHSDRPDAAIDART